MTIYHTLAYDTVTNKKAHVLVTLLHHVGKYKVLSFSIKQLNSFFGVKTTEIEPLAIDVRGKYSSVT
jgi:hypothetical protein